VAPFDDRQGSESVVSSGAIHIVHVDRVEVWEEMLFLGLRGGSRRLVHEISSEHIFINVNFLREY